MNIFKCIKPMLSIVMSKNTKTNAVCLVLLVMALVVSCQPKTTISNQDTTWSVYGGGLDQSKYFVQNQITKDNIKQLQVAYSYSTHDKNTYLNNPIIVDNVMYVLAKDRSLVAINASTGEEIWIHAKLEGLTRRGITYWENDDRSDRRIIFTLNNSLQAIDAITGKSILTFGKEGAVDIREGLGRDVSRLASRNPPTIFEDLIIMGSFTGESYLSAPGHIRAYNVLTGKMEWIFHTIPQPGEYGYDTWPPEAYKYVGGVNNWASMSVDEKRGIIFIPIGSPTYDFYGADRIGSNLFGNTLLALNIRTGKRIWHFQTVHHDLWDYDLSSAPQLFTVNIDGKRVDAVSVATKSGFMFAFERETGKPLWPIEERPVPASTVPGEEAWPTQPFPTHIPPYIKQVINEDDISPILLTDEEFNEWKERTAKARKGVYTPPDTSETIAMPGATGGVNWGNTASNPEKGMVYILGKATPSFFKLTLQKPKEPQAEPRREQKSKPQVQMSRGIAAVEKHCAVCHGADLGGNAVGPSLLDVGNIFTKKSFAQILETGVGRMPAVMHIEDNEVSEIWAYLRYIATGTNVEETQEETLLDGPVVASGGAPGQALLPKGGREDSDYPTGLDVPANRYTTGYGMHAKILNPPWSFITAYDMNTGTIKWTRPHGEHPAAVAKGHFNTGVPSGSSGQGMIVTSNGIIFATVRNGQIYAYDAESGDILWRDQTNRGISTISSMYEVDGQIYLVVNATGAKQNKKTTTANSKAQWGEYVVYSLPR